MEQLKKAIGDLPLLAVCSDACKGLENAVKNVFPNVEQRECFYHMVRNFKKRFRGFGQIYPAARAYREDIFCDNIAKMVSESPAAVQWLHANHKLLGIGVLSTQKFNVTTLLATLLSHLITGLETIRTYRLLTLLIRSEK